MFCKKIFVLSGVIFSCAMLTIFARDVITLPDAKLTLPCALYSTISSPLIINGVVEVSGEGQTFTLANTCLIKKGANLIINHGVTLKIAPHDGNVEPIQFEDNTGSIIFNDAAMQISNYNGIYIKKGTLEFTGRCGLRTYEGLSGFMLESYDFLLGIISPLTIKLYLSGLLPDPDTFRSQKSSLIIQENTCTILMHPQSTLTLLSGRFGFDEEQKRKI